MQSNLHLTSGFGPLVLMFSKSWSFVLLTSLIRFWIVWETWNEVCMMKCWFLYLKWRNVEMLLSSVWRTICFSTSSLLNPFKSLLVCGFACRWVTAHPCRHGDDSNTTLLGHSSLFPSRASGSPFSSTPPHFLLLPTAFLAAYLSLPGRVPELDPAPVPNRWSCFLWASRRPPCQAESKPLKYATVMAMNQQIIWMALWKLA